MQQTSRIKICLIGDMLSDGGAERVMADLSNYFHSIGIVVHIIIIQDKVAYRYSGTLLNLGKDMAPGAINKIKRFFRLRRYLREHKFDFVIDFRYKNNFIQEWIANELIYEKSKVIFTIHSSTLKYYIPDNNFLASLVFRKAYGLVTVSDAIKEAIIKRPFSADVKRIYNPVDTAYINSRSEEAFDPGFKYILAAGSMNGDTKQFDRLIDAYAASVLPADDIKLVILGEGKLRDTYMRQVKGLELEDKVIFPGFKENPYVYMRDSLFYVLSSKFEGMPMVLIEALACGTPAVAFNCFTGPSEIIEDGQNGLLIKDQDFEELTNGMNRMYLNKELYDTCKANAAAGIEKFSMENVGRTWMEYLKIEE
jgi:glycosyltransferase involved in cell wall biosynthesis